MPPMSATAASRAVPAIHAGAVPEAEQIHAEEVALLYRNAGVSQFVVLIASPVLAAAVWQTARPGFVVAWLAIMIAITVARLHLGAAFRRADPRPEQIHRWRSLFLVGVACSGATWGGAALFLMPAGASGSQFVVTFTLAGMVAAAVPTLALVPRAFHLFCGLSLAPLAYRFFDESDRTHAALGALVVLYMFGMSGIARRIHASLRTTLELRHQNGALVEVLRRANADTEAVNTKLVLEVAEHRRTGSDLERSLSLLRATLESTNDGIVVIDLAGRVISHNQRFLDMWRLPADVVENGSAEALLAHVRPQVADPQAFLARVRELLASRDIECHDIVELADGRVFERYSVPQRIGGEAVGRVCSYRDVTERRNAEANLEFIANHDALTGLPNRSLFARSLADALARARRRDERLAVLYIDLDRFKNINDTLGHDAGDRLLREVAQRLRAALRETDTVARLGGDEFVVLAEDLHGTVAAFHVAQRLLDALGRAVVVDGREYHVTASIGISTYPEDGPDVATLLKHADIAMYRAKEKGKNAFEAYAAEMNVHSVERLALEAGLRRAVERDELVLHYQPKIELSTRRIVGVEALVRWRHPELGFVSPGAFIPLAEETGLIVPIGEWVLLTACGQAQRWSAEGLVPMRMAVNLSARQFVRDDLPQRIDAILRESGLAADRLELELTESATMHDVDRALGLLTALRERGIRLAIDDFGTGYSSLGYLKRFPIDSVKIDRSFVRDVPHETGDCALAQAVIAMAHALGLRAVAEGVETAEQLAFLQHHGCDEVQGFHFARPMPAEELAAFVREHERAQADRERRSA